MNFYLLSRCSRQRRHRWTYRGRDRRYPLLRVCDLRVEPPGGHLVGGGRYRHPGEPYPHPALTQRGVGHKVEIFSYYNIFIFCQSI